VTLTVAGEVDSAELDHIEARSKGGKDEMSNYQLLCRDCNGRKHVKDREAFERSYAKRVGALWMKKV
jgi:5-methylcytosine-specific restriction endonuclease McrA